MTFCACHRWPVVECMGADTPAAGPYRPRHANPPPRRAPGEKERGRRVGALIVIGGTAAFWTALALAVEAWARR